MRFTTIGPLACVALFMFGAPAQALSILPNFFSSTAGPDNDPDFGGGNIESIFNAAAEIWESAILDDRTVTIPFMWVEGSSGLGFSDGSSVFISRDNNWFLDPTPDSSSEYTSLTRGTASIDTFSVNYNVGFSGGAGTATGFDLLSVMLHEIGHVLSFGPNALADWADGDVDVATPLPLAGLSIPMHPRCCHMDLPPGYTDASPLMFPFFDSGERRLISDADLLFVAQSGGWQQVDRSSRFMPVPEPRALALIALGAGLVLRRRSVRNVD